MVRIPKKEIAMKPVHIIDELHFSKNILSLNVNGEENEFELREISQSLFNTTNEERSQFEISPSGYGIHWPLIDEDLSINGLLNITHSSIASNCITN